MSFAVGDIPKLEGIHRPDPIAMGIAAYENTYGATPPVGESTETARHATQAWLGKKQADR